jgi:antitoxin CptB
MDIDIDQLKKKIIYRSIYRGTREMDKLLSSFTNSHIDNLTNDDLIDLEKLLDIDDNNLYNYYNNLKTDIKFKDNKVNLLFKNFKYNENI